MGYIHIESDRSLNTCTISAVYRTTRPGLATGRQPGAFYENSYGSSWSISPGGSPKKGKNKEYKDFSPICSVKIRAQKLVFLDFPGVLEGLGSSGRLIGTISTFPRTYKCLGSRVMAKNPPGKNKNMKKILISKCS